MIKQITLFSFSFIFSFMLCEIVFHVVEVNSETIDCDNTGDCTALSASGLSRDLQTLISRFFLNSDFHLWGDLR